MGDCKRKPTQPSLAELGLQLRFSTSWDFAKNSRNKLSQVVWVGRLEKVEIKPSQQAGAAAGLSLAKLGMKKIPLKIVDKSKFLKKNLVDIFFLSNNFLFQNFLGSKISDPKMQVNQRRKVDDPPPPPAPAENIRVEIVLAYCII